MPALAQTDTTATTPDAQATAVSANGGDQQADIVATGQTNIFVVGLTEGNPGQGQTQNASSGYFYSRGTSARPMADRSRSVSRA